MKRTAKGFSLIELLIVVAIILIIAAIAIPNLLRSRIAANQASAVGSLKAINTAEVAYTTTYNIGYSAALVNLAPPSSGQPTSTSAGLIDSTLASGTKAGYTLTYTASTAVNGQVPGYTVTASPQAVGQTGQNFYFTDESDVIRFNTSATAAVTDSPIGG
ncbi:MAG TPA: prepilin-type N-terminal cleavage/methylation domain-containing protein [Terriglobia bacterium]|nr:prepilin-type N-terminal cleavage/methylation domain-containing protein [Terriglobia bacterium]